MDVVVGMFFGWFCVCVCFVGVYFFTDTHNYLELLDINYSIFVIKRDFVPHCIRGEVPKLTLKAGNTLYLLAYHTGLIYKSTLALT